ncbi:hypothetical protein [Micromonospora sp. CPCC 205556]|uniref:hypothetical protein n=1 Tax=Micromonospora sp. CPCC 205556 TaxID=3122398 RepID=UPI002FF04531
MKREELTSLLGSDAPANAACRAALEQGASFHIWDGSIPASTLAPAYRRREAITRGRGIPTLGFAVAVETLDALGDQPVRLGGVRQLEPPYHFQLFLSADATSVLACLAVDQQCQARRR